MARFKVCTRQGNWLEVEARHVRTEESGLVIFERDSGPWAAAAYRPDSVQLIIEAAGSEAE